MSSTPLLPHERHRAHRCAVTFILVAESLERLAYYGLVGNMIQYLRSPPLNWTLQIASTAALVTAGVTFFVGVVGGWLSDTLGRRSCHIIAGYLVYLSGLGVMTTLGYRTDHNDESSNQWEGSNLCYFWFGVLLSAVGAGIVRTNMAPFGGDQVRPDGMPKAIKFFNLYYWVINVGSLISFVCVVMMEQLIGYFSGFLLSTIVAFTSFILFTLGKCLGFYIERRAGIEPCKVMFSIVRNAREIKKSSQWELECKPSCFIDYAKSKYGGNYPHHQVEDMKNLVKVISVFTLMLPYWFVSSMMFESLFSLQTVLFTSKLNCTNIEASSYNTCTIITQLNTTEISPSLEASNALTIVILIPITAVLYRCLAGRNIKVTTRWRMICGLIIFTAALCMATIAEVLRHQDVVSSLTACLPVGNDDTNIEDEICSAVNFYPVMFFQYCLMGAAEVFTVVAGLEYAYVMAPQAMQGLIIGLYWMFQGFGFFIATAVHRYHEDVNIQTLYFNTYLRNVFVIYCVSIGIWAVVFSLLTYYLPLDLQKVIIIGGSHDAGSTRERDCDSVNS